MVLLDLMAGCHHETMFGLVSSSSISLLTSVQCGHTRSISRRVTILSRRLSKPGHHRGRRPLREQRHHQRRTLRIYIPYELPTNLRRHRSEGWPGALRPDTTFCSNVVRPAVSVQEQQPGLNAMVGGFLPLPHDPPAPNYLPDAGPGDLDAFSFTNGSFDPSFNEPLDFSFDDYIKDPSSVAAEFGTGAA